MMIRQVAEGYKKILIDWSNEGTPEEIKLKNEIVFETNAEIRKRGCDFYTCKTCHDEDERISLVFPYCIKCSCAQFEIIFQNKRKLLMIRKQLKRPLEIKKRLWRLYL